MYEETGLECGTRRADDKRIRILVGKTESWTFHPMYLLTAYDSGHLKPRRYFTYRQV
jgi:hypothetical protein